MDNFEKFNQSFPNSNYRLVWSRYTGDTNTLEGKNIYQGRKAPINSNLLKYEQVLETLSIPKYNNYRVGWIVSTGYTVVDIDDKQSADTVYKILTDTRVKFSCMISLHGAHFIFKECEGIYQTAGDINAIGLSVDTRVSNKGYIILPVNDCDRHWDILTNDLDEVPFWLRPLKKFKKTSDLLGMDSGGRNDALLKHFLALLDYGKGLSVDEKIECIKIINKYLFKEPLPESELKSTILRESLIEEHSHKNKETLSCLEERIANKILEKYKIINVGGLFYIYDGRHYRVVNETKELERLIHFEYSETLKEHQRQEVIKFLALKSWVSTTDVNKEWNEIVFNNGIYNIATNKLDPHDSDKYNTTLVPWDYYPNAEYSGMIDDFFNELCKDEPDKKCLLYEIIGYCLIRKNIFSKFFVCYGGGGTGKSTYLKLIEKLVGSNNTSYLSLQDLENQWLPSELFGKLVNIGDDISSRALKDTPILKKATTGEMLLAQRKFVQQPLCFVNYAKMITACNQIPSIYDTTTGLYRRMVLINIDRKIENPDPFFLDKLTNQDMEYLLSQAIKYVRMAITRGSLTKCLSSEMALEKYRREQSSVLTYLEEFNYTVDRLHMKPCAAIYEEYKAFCIQCGFIPYKKPRFDEEVCRALTLDKRRTTMGGDSLAWRFIRIVSEI